jgi:hypothetical protein
MMSEQKPPSNARGTVQVPLGRADRDLLEEVAAATGLSHPEIFRRGLRRLASEVLRRAPGWSLSRLVGSLDSTAQLPEDLAQRHDDYLYGSRGDGPE